MSCGCAQTPCSCTSFPPDYNCPPPSRSKCDRDTTNNVWIERGCTPNDVNAPGVCMLDTMTEEQVIYAIERDDRARTDLMRVTSDQRLQELARTVPRLPPMQEDDAMQKYLNRDNQPASSPFYALFRGQPPFAQ